MYLFIVSSDISTIVLTGSFCVPDLSVLVVTGTLPLESEDDTRTEKRHLWPLHQPHAYSLTHEEKTSIVSAWFSLASVYILS